MSESYKSDANDNGMEKWVDSDSSVDSDPPRTRLGRKQIPETKSSRDLLYQLRRYRNDVPFLATIIRKSEVVFKGERLRLRSRVLECARLEREYGNIYPYYEALDAFIDALGDRIVEEFYEDRRDMYTNVFEILEHSSFPYSRNQGNCLDGFREAIYESTGYPFDEADEIIDARIKELVGLFESEDHLRDTTPFRVVIHSMIPYYLREMVKKLEALSKKEKGREIPMFAPNSETLNLATYLKEKLEPLVDREKLFTNLEHFNRGMLEVYNHLVEIFRSPHLSFSTDQEVLFQKVERDVRAFKRKFVWTKHHEINESCYNFMKEFEENHPNQEWVLDENEEYVLVPNSVRNQTIRDMGSGLYCLQHAATEHLDALPTFGLGVANIVENITERFLGLYPMR